MELQAGPLEQEEALLEGGPVHVALLVQDAGVRGGGERFLHGRLEQHQRVARHGVR